MVWFSGDRRVPRGEYAVEVRETPFSVEVRLLPPPFLVTMRYVLVFKELPFGRFNSDSLWVGYEPMEFWGVNRSDTEVERFLDTVTRILSEGELHEEECRTRYVEVVDA